MDRNYWQEYWDNYYKFMAVYLREVQEAYPEMDIKSEYTEVASLFEPVMPIEEYQTYEPYDNSGGDNNSEMDDDPPLISPAGGPSAAPFIFPGGGSFPQPFTPPGGGQNPQPFISPGGGQFTINNCSRMAIVRIEMRRGFNPGNFFMVVDRADNRSIQGFRIACEGNRVRFVPMAVEYRNINLIECAF